MSRKKKIIWIIAALVLSAAAFWWTTIKKRVVKTAVTKTLQKKTDSLYSITYDTSEIDELNGDVFLKNVQIKLDSAQWVRQVHKDSLPAVTLSVVVGKITIKGLKELKLLSNSSLDVSGIILENPVFRLDKWKGKDTTGKSFNDTLEIYKRLVGQFDFLRVKKIQIVNGQFTLLDQTKREVFTAAGINIEVDDFLVDSTHNYHSILSYFVKQTRATVGSVKGSGIKTGKLTYDSRGKLILAENMEITGTSDVTCKSIAVTGLSTEAFVYRGAIDARKMLVVQPQITIRPRTKKASGNPGALPDAKIDSLVVNNGSVTVMSKKSNPIRIKGADLIVRNMQTVNGDLVIENYLDPSSLSCKIESVEVPVRLHRIQLSHITYPGTGNLLSVAKVQMQPTISREQLTSKIGKQTDLYNITADQVAVEGFDIKKMVKQKSLEIKKITTQMSLQVFDDKTLPIDSVKKGRGRFPYEAVTRSNMPINIRAVELRHSRIAYEEKAPKTEMTGIVFFDDINGIASNITNIPSLLAKDHTMKIEASARVMGSGRLQSQWLIPLNDPNVPFSIKGSVAPFPVTALSSPFEKLSLTRIRSGQLDEMRFTINGDRMSSNGNLVFKYHDLKVDMLKKDENDSLKKKGVMSFIANADIKNKNTSGDPKDFTYERDRYKSFFNLIWKSIFAGGKKAILIIH